MATTMHIAAFAPTTNDTVVTIAFDARDPNDQVDVDITFEPDTAAEALAVLTEAVARLQVYARDYAAALADGAH